jgi:hypothetical protein
MDIERIRRLVIRDLHGLNLRSGKALCTVVPSSRVTTRK